MKKTIFKIGLSFLIFSGCSAAQENADTKQPVQLSKEELTNSNSSVVIKLSENGIEDALFELAMRYWYAEDPDVKEDREKAKDILKQLAQNNYAEAQNELGRFYTNGNHPFRTNKTLAYAWFLIASENGNENAARRLDPTSKFYPIIANYAESGRELAERCKKENYKPCL